MIGSFSERQRSWSFNRGLITERARWVLTWKSTGKAKARLCALGFQDPDLTEVPRDSPTLSAASEALTMQQVASRKYRLISGDIKDVRQMLNLDHEIVLLQSWLDHRVFELVKKKFVGQERERVMRARWVLTWKSIGKAKARVCVLGFQDPDLTEVPRDSPTSSAASEALIMQWVVSHKYRLISGDIKTAFLSGDEDIRNIFISPPDDVRQMLNLDHETVLRLRKAVYGLVNAPKKCWDRLNKSLIEHGFTSCDLDLCAFVLRTSGKIMEYSVCMSMMQSEVEMRLSTES